jgi:flagellar motor switch protein FliG
MAKTLLDANPNHEQEEREILLERIRAVQGDDLLSTWEDEFIDSIEYRVNNGFDLSPTQMEKLEQIEEKLGS